MPIPRTHDQDQPAARFTGGRVGQFLLASLLLALSRISGVADGPVTLTEDRGAFTLDNGRITARIAKAGGTLTSLRFEGLELIAPRASGAQGGYWSWVGGVRVGTGRVASVIQDPAANQGERAEVSCRLVTGADEEQAAVEMDLRYVLGRGDSGLYVAAIWRHAPGWPAFSVGEARYCLKLNPEVFDFLTVDEARRRVMPSPEDWDRGAPLNVREARRMTTGVHRGQAEHKYGYSAVFTKTPAYGWSSTRHNVGFWMINPSLEYVSGGPTKMELTGHLDVNPGGTPTLLNMWLGSHYGGSSLAVARDESWTKVIGPFFIYCNALPTRETNAPTSAAADAAQARLWQGALAHARIEADRWPYPWFQHAEYPPADGRGTVSGRLVLSDRYAPWQGLTNAWIGLTAPDYQPASGGARSGGAEPSATTPRRDGFPPYVDWQRDAKFYQVWSQPDDTGRFALGNVRPGRHTLRAISEGIIGEFALAEVEVTAGSTNALGTLHWQPTRHGRTLWQIGIPDRTAREFRRGAEAWQWGTYFHYLRDFPNDVDFVVGQSDWRRDWFYTQPPRWGAALDEDGAPGDPPPWRTRVRSTTWTIRFELPDVPRGRATLRLAFCGSHAGCKVEASVNGRRIGETAPLPSTSAMQRDGAQAYWTERPLAFDAALLRAGENVLALLSHANLWSQGVLYDVVRLELDEAADPP